MISVSGKTVWLIPLTYTGLKDNETVAVLYMSGVPSVVGETGPLEATPGAFVNEDIGMRGSEILEGMM